MPAHHLNPDVSNTAARYVAKAMTRVNPAQHEELLLATIEHALEGLAVLRSKPRTARIETLRPILTTVRQIDPAAWGRVA